MQAFCQKIADSKPFHTVVVGLILILGIVLGLETSPEIMQKHGKFLHLLDNVILWLFVIEIAIRMGAYGRQPLNFFKDSWNTFDFIIVFICFLPLGAHFAAVFRLARILRMLRLLSVIPKLQILVGALLKSIPSMGYVALLLLLLFYIYAVIGVHTFGGHDPIHFGTLSVTMLTLFEIVTLEGWTQLIEPLLYAKSNTNGVVFTPHAASAIIYFVTFILLGTMIMLNLLIGVILNGMEEMQKEIISKKMTASAHLSIADELTQLEKEIEAVQNHLGQVKFRLQNHKEA